MDLAYKISDIYSNISYNDIPDEDIDIAKKFILDTIGVAIAAKTAPGVEETYKAIKNIGCDGDSSVIGKTSKFKPTDAAFLNSLMAHAIDFDDTLDESATHCCVTTLPPALALGEYIGASGKDLLVSMILGIDTVARLSMSIKTPLSWIRTSTCGSFGSAISSSKILGFNVEKMRNTLGIVYSQTSGNAQCLIDGALTKRIQPAFSSRSGVLSALLSEAGITGAQNVFEGKYGFFNLYENGNYEKDIILNKLGVEFMIEKLSIKPYPTCRMTHASIDAALDALKKLPKDFNYEDIEEINVKVCKMSKEMVGKAFKIRDNPQVDAQFSIPYNVSVVFTKKDSPFIEDLDNETILAHKWDKLVNKINIVEDNKLDAKDIFKSTLSLKLKNGKVIESKVRTPKGNPLNPLSWDECIKKFKGCVKYGNLQKKDNEIDNFIEQVLNLENIKDLSELFL